MFRFCVAVRVAAAAACAVAVPTPALCSGRHLVQPPQIDLLRLEGRVGPPAADDKGTIDLELRHKGETIRFQLQELKVLSGGRLPGRVLSDVRPYKPNFILFGAAAMVQRLATAGPKDRVRIFAYNRLGSRNLMVTEVEIEPPAGLAK